MSGAGVFVLLLVIACALGLAYGLYRLALAKIGTNGEFR